jgi:micrococcal nuclease
MPRSRLLALALLLGAVVAMPAGLLLVHRLGEAPLPSTGTVARVVDGDTFVLDSGERVRLLGIDTPETVDPDRPVGCFGPEASQYAKHLLTGQRVRLVYDPEHHDRYGRLLAYVYLIRGARPPLFVNARLLTAGYARTMSIPPNIAHASDLAALEAQAALAGRGLWSAC